MAGDSSRLWRRLVRGRCGNAPRCGRCIQGGTCWGTGEKGPRVVVAWRTLHSGARQLRPWHWVCL
eukprot:7499851-Pyramimonas_sp.AAC.1